MLSDALTYFPQLYYATNAHCLALQKVVEVNATEEGYQHSEKLNGLYCNYHKRTLYKVVESNETESMMNECLIRSLLKHICFWLLAFIELLWVKL